MCIHLQWYKPYLSRFMNNVETFNEVTILFLNYCLFCFTDFVPEARTRNDLGFHYNNIALINVAFHFLIIFGSSLRKVRLLIKRYYN